MPSGLAAGAVQETMTLALAHSAEKQNVPIRIVSFGQRHDARRFLVTNVHTHTHAANSNEAILLCTLGDINRVHSIRAWQSSTKDPAQSPTSDKRQD